jgi:hypothetical protein
MAKNVGTLISAAIRPNDSLDPIATAYASEIRGGLHSATSSTDRDSIIFERREWGMMCYVIDESKTYQLTYGYSNTNIMNNSNWKEFSGSGDGGGGSEWIDSVISVNLTQPLSPTNGDRYLLGLDTSVLLSGVVWQTLTASQVVEWNGSISQWEKTVPTNGMSVRVDNQDNAIYKYEGNFPSGTWIKEETGQVRNLYASSANGYNYIATTSPPIDSYVQDQIFLTKFSTQNLGTTASININALGSIDIKKPSPSGIVDLLPSDIQPNVVYSLVFDGINFQLNRPYINDDLFNVKYDIQASDYIVVPQYYQYWVYGDLTISGTLVNYGHVVVANGNIIMSGGSFSNFGQLALVTLSTSGSGLTPSFYNSSTIDFTTQNTIYGLSVSAIVKDGSLTASKLDTGSNGGATAGYLLSVDSVGNFNWISNSSGALVTSDKNYIMPFNTSGDGQSTGLIISETPTIGSYVGVFVNGQEFQVGIGVSVSVDCYFSSDGGTTPNTNIQAGDELYWNGNFAGTDLYTTWRLSLFYSN